MPEELKTDEQVTSDLESRAEIWEMLARFKGRIDVLEAWVEFYKQLFPINAQPLIKEQETKLKGY